MDNFDYIKYLAEGRLLKEDLSQFEDYIIDMFNGSVDEEEGYQSDVWEKSEYTSDAYEGDDFIKLSSYLKSVGSKATLEGNPDITVELLRNGDIKWSADVTLSEDKLLKENIDLKEEEGEIDEDMKEFRSLLSEIDGHQSELEYALRQISLKDSDLEMELQDALTSLETVITEIQESEGWI